MAYPESGPGKKDKVGGLGVVAYGGDGTNFYPLKVDSDGNLIVQLETSPTIDIGDVTLLPNSGVDIGDVDVTSVANVVPGVAATNLGKAEDAAHTSGDVGVMALGVRKDKAAALAPDGDYVPLQTDALGNLRTASGGAPTFGKPTLSSANNGKAMWTRGSTSPLDQKGSTGWLAELIGGLQTGDDWARLNIPVNELLVTDLDAAMWSYHMAAQTFGVNMVIWVHDPADFDKRAEITQLANIATLEKGAGWNAHELNIATAQFFFYGEGVSGNDVCTTAGPANLYTWAQYQLDALFSTWVIYRITFEHGWEASGTFTAAHVADVKLNGQQVHLGPTDGKHKKTVQTSQTMLATAKTTDEVIAHSTDAGVDWDFDFGGTGYIVKAWLANSADITPRLRLYLFSRPPTGALNDEQANTNPVTADLPYFVGCIDFPAMSQQGTGDAFALATPSTTGNLPLAFDSPVIYGVLVQRDATATFTATPLTISLTADMEDN